MRKIFIAIVSLTFAVALSCSCKSMEAANQTKEISIVTGYARIIGTSSISRIEFIDSEGDKYFLKGDFLNEIKQLVGKKIEIKGEIRDSAKSLDVKNYRLLPDLGFEIALLGTLIGENNILNREDNKEYLVEGLPQYFMKENIGLVIWILGNEFKDGAVKAGYFGTLNLKKDSGMKR
jgi:hypothetical protein